MTIGQLTIEPDGDRYVLRGPRRAGPSVEVAPADLREWARLDDKGRYRPLPGAKTLRGGWHVRLANDSDLAAAIDDVYPLAALHRAQWHDGSLRVVSFDEVAARQTGRYRVAGHLSPRGRRAVREALCGVCVKAPLWCAPPAGAPAASDPAVVPCPEPCSVYLALAREAALWEEDPPAPAPVDPGVPFAAFEEPGNALREAVLAALATASGARP